MKNVEPDFEKKVIDCIKDFRRENGYLPLQSEIASKLDMSRQKFHNYFKPMLENGSLDAFPEYKRYNQSK